MFDFILFFVIIHDFPFTIHSQRNIILTRQCQFKEDMLPRALSSPKGKRFTDDDFTLELQVISFIWRVSTTTKWKVSHSGEVSNLDEDSYKQVLRSSWKFYLLKLL